MEFDSLGLATGYDAYMPQTVDTAPTLPKGDSKAASAEEAPKTRDMPIRRSADKTADKKDDDKKVLTVSEDEITSTIETANKKIEPLFLEFRHSIHEKTNSLMISVVNTATGEVVREIPPEKTLDALAKMWELTGILVDQKG